MDTISDAVGALKSVTVKRCIAESSANRVAATITEKSFNESVGDM